jgi:uncharacterized OsmC-like protein
MWGHDQDEAVAFSTQKLGFEVRSDVTVPEMGDFRWLTVAPPGQPHVAIVLMAIPGPPVMDAATADHKGRGVAFVEQPEERPYGIDSSFRDPSGNNIRLTQGDRRRVSPTGPSSARLRVFEVTTVTVHGKSTAVGSAGPHTLVVDRSAEAGGAKVGFNGGELLYLTVAGCISSDLFRQAIAEGISLRHVRVTVRGDYSGDPAVSEEIGYEIEVDGDAAPERLTALVQHADEIAKIPNSLRAGTPVRLASVRPASASR